MRGWWFWEWGKGEKRGGEADWAAPRPASSLGAKCPGLAEKGVNTSSLHHPHRRRLPPSLPAIQRTPTRLAEGTEGRPRTPAAAPRSEAQSPGPSRQLPAARRDREGCPGWRDSTRAPTPASPARSARTWAPRSRSPRRDTQFRLSRRPASGLRTGGQVRG